MQSLLNTGVAGLLAAQHQLATTGHNITNVATPGYHRQTAVQTTPPPIRTSHGYASQGARIESVARSYNQFLENQIRHSESSWRRTAPTAGRSPCSTIFSPIPPPGYPPA